MLALYYSLAIHMRQRLGEWPTDIGEGGFPTSLAAHAQVTVGFCLAFAAFAVLGAPVAVMGCCLARRWMWLAPYLGLSALLFVVCWFIMQVAAPEPFLNWWRD